MSEKQSTAKRYADRLLRLRAEWQHAAVSTADTVARTNALLREAKAAGISASAILGQIAS